MLVCCECCVLSGRGLCDGLITRPEKSYRLWCVVVCYLETSRMRPRPALGRSATGGGGQRWKKSIKKFISSSNYTAETPLSSTAHIIRINKLQSNSTRCGQIYWRSSVCTATGLSRREKRTWMSSRLRKSKHRH